MTAVFTPHLDVLGHPQRLLWDELGGVPDDFVLYGGTAIALHLGHRQSVDFDFFSHREIDPMRLAAALPFMAGGTVTQMEPNTLGVIVDRNGPVRLSFFGLPSLRRVMPPHGVDPPGVRVASLIDLAGTKAAVVQARAEEKDYVDMDAILRTGAIDLPTALAAAGAIYGRMFNPQITLKALSYFGDPGLRHFPEPARERLVRAVRAVDLDRLPVLPGCPP